MVRSLLSRNVGKISSSSVARGKSRAETDAIDSCSQRPIPLVTLSRARCVLFPGLGDESNRLGRTVLVTGLLAGRGALE